MAGFFSKDKTIKLLRKDYECCQCHKKICDVYVKPEQEDQFDDSYPCCWPCFLKLCDEARINREKETNK